MSDVPSEKPALDIYGQTRNGDYVQTVTITASDGMSASILTLGARLLDLRLADDTPLVLSYNSLDQVEADTAYVGVAVGRTANRIRGGQLRRHKSITHRTFLEPNENEVNHAHGGKNAWDKRLFAVTELSESTAELYMFSPDGDQGYPSSVHVTVRYELTGTGKLVVNLTTTNVGSEQTVTNMTLHPYFDLKGSGGIESGSVVDYVLCAPRCSRYLVLDSQNVPTGQIASVDDTRFNFRAPRKLHETSDVFPGYDHYFIAKQESSLHDSIEPLVTVTAPHGDHGSAVEMEVLSNQPGFQMYTANGFDGNGPGSFAQHGSIAIEPSGFIDAANHDAFPTIALDPNQTRKQVIMYSFRIIEP